METKQSPPLKKQKPTPWSARERWHLLRAHFRNLPDLGLNFGSMPATDIQKKAVVDSFVQALPETERTPGAIIQRLRIECTPDHFSESQALNVVGKLLEVSYSEFGSSVAPSQNETEWSSREDVALLLARLAALNETWSDAGQLDVGLQSMCTITRRDPDSVRRRVSELLPIERNVHPLITLYRTVQQLMDAVISDGELHTQDTHVWSNREDMSLLLARFASLDETCSDARRRSVRVRRRESERYANTGVTETSPIGCALEPE